MAEDAETTQDVDPAQGEALARALRGDRAAGIETLRARAAAKAALFGTPVEGTRVDRYFVLSLMGEGAMGSVFSAYDPKLDRKVALKVLKADSASTQGNTQDDGAQQTMLREAQALAQVRHRNVVHVYDAGTFNEHVFLTMELVEGETLRSWLENDEDRGWKGSLSMLMQAGRGLAAVHAAGLVHRDFKPDNVLIGKDGVARVVDFGLARADSHAVVDTMATTPGRVGSDRTLAAGTPAYLAPERAKGVAADAHSDLFSFCVVVFEGLAAQRPYPTAAILTGEYSADERARLPAHLPAWLARALDRGLDPDPAARQGSMAELLAEFEAGLAADQVSERRNASAKRIGVGLALVAAVGAGLYGASRIDRSARIAACEEAAAEISAVWNDEARDRIRAGLTASGDAYAASVPDRVMPWLDAYAAQWSEARRSTCEQARVTGAWDAAMSESANWCLEEMRIELASVVEQLEQADENVAENAVTAASSLPSPNECQDEASLSRRPVPPFESRDAALEIRAELGEAGALVSTGRYAEGLEMIDPAIERARAAKLMALEAALLDEKGTMLEGMVDYPAAEAASKAAYFSAVRAGAWGTAADAATALSYNVGRVQRRPDLGELWADLAQLALENDPDHLGLRAAWLLGSRAANHLSRENWDEAIELGREELALTQDILGPKHPRVASVVSDLAISYSLAGEFDRAEELFRRALAIREATLSPDHPTVAKSLSNVAHVLHDKGDSEGARAYDRRSLETFERALGPEHPAVARALLNLGVGHYRMGEFEQGNVPTRRALAIYEKVYGVDHPAVAQAAGNLGQGYTDLGEYDHAEPLLRRRVEILEKLHGADDPRLCDPLGVLGHALLELDRGPEALLELERAAKIADASEQPPGTAFQVRFALARALTATGGDRARAVALVHDAREEHERSAPLSPELQAEVDAFLAAD